MQDNRTKSQIYSDNIAEFCGSWGFVSWTAVTVFGWIFINQCIYLFDQYPYTFLNLMLTIVSTLQSPIIMMSQNRQVERDRDNVNGLHAKLDALEKLIKEKR